MKRLLLAGLCLAAALLIIQGCAYNNLKDLKGSNNSTCPDSLLGSPTYLAGIRPILDDKCVSCHAQDNSSGGVMLDTYGEVKRVADNGKLYGSISHANGFEAMPQGAAKLSDCELARVKKWIDTGAANN